jgi:hypothetical protein
MIRVVVRVTSAVMLISSPTAILFSVQPAWAGCNPFGCSNSSNAECNPFGCPNGPLGQACTPFGCPASPQPQSDRGYDRSEPSRYPLPEERPPSRMSGWAMKVCVRTGRQARLFDGPSTSYQVVGNVDRGEEIYVTGRTKLEGGYRMRQLADGRWIDDGLLCRN